MKMSMLYGSNSKKNSDSRQFCNWWESVKKIQTFYLIVSLGNILTLTKDNRLTLTKLMLAWFPTSVIGSCLQLHGVILVCMISNWCYWLLSSIAWCYWLVIIKIIARKYNAILPSWNMGGIRNRITIILNLNYLIFYFLSIKSILKSECKFFFSD
jgi:hypothetical protein